MSRLTHHLRGCSHRWWNFVLALAIWAGNRNSRCRRAKDSTATTTLNLNGSLRLLLIHLWLLVCRLLLECRLLLICMLLLIGRLLLMGRLLLIGRLRLLNHVRLYGHLLTHVLLWLLLPSSTASHASRAGSHHQACAHWLGCHHHLLLMRWHDVHDSSRRTEIAFCLHVLDFNLLLSVHTTVHRHDETVDRIVALLRKIVETPNNVKKTYNADGKCDDVIVTGCVVLAEPSLNHEPVATVCAAWAAVDLAAKAHSILWLLQTAARIHSSTTNVRLPGEI